MSADAVITPLEMLYRWEKETPDKVYLRQPKALQWTEYTWSQFADQVRRVAAWLKAQNYAPGSRIALWSGNSKDWVVADFAIMMAGHISVPLYPGQDVESARYIVEHSGACLAFLGDFDQWREAEAALPGTVARVALAGCSVPCALTLGEIVERSAPLRDSPLPDPEATMTLIYTSGTTGRPKGVIHSHRGAGLVSLDMIDCFRHVVGAARYFSYLPMSHAAERVLVELSSLYSNGTISFSEGLATFAEELRSVQPTFFFSVPRLWLKFKAGVDARIPPETQAKLTPDGRRQIARQLGLAEATFILTGSAPCPRDVHQWFLDLGIVLREGYAMTETFVHGTSWMRDDAPLPGCMGQPFSQSVEIKLSDEGEILLRTPALMQGYYRDPEKTAEVLVDGWYRSGDAGRIDEEGNLWLTGRISEVFKTTKGKFVRPTTLENHFGRSRLLAQFCVFGHGLDQPVVAVTLSESGLLETRAALQQKLAALLDEINAELPPWERISRLVAAAQEWTMANGLLTPTLKIKRKAIEERFRAFAGADVREPVVFE